MLPEDYDAFIADPTRWLLDVYLPRIHADMAEPGSYRAGLALIRGTWGLQELLTKQAQAGAAWAAGVPGAHGRSHAAAEFRAAALPAPGVQAWSAAGSLRHTFATLAALGGVPMHVTARQLGHSTTRMIAEVYSHVLPEMQREVVRRVRAVAERNDTQKHNTQDHS